MLLKYDILFVIGYMFFMGFASTISSIFGERVHDITLTAIILVGIVGILAVVVDSFRSELRVRKQRSVSTQAVTPLVKTEKV